MPDGLANRFVERVTNASMTAAARLARKVTSQPDTPGFRPSCCPCAGSSRLFLRRHPDPTPAAAAWRQRWGSAAGDRPGGPLVEEKGGDGHAPPPPAGDEPRRAPVFAGETNVV
jgi:hypothetical protein